MDWEYAQQHSSQQSDSNPSHMRYAYSQTTLTEVLHDTSLHRQSQDPSLYPPCESGRGARGRTDYRSLCSACRVVASRSPAACEPLKRGIQRQGFQVISRDTSRRITFRDFGREQTECSSDRRSEWFPVIGNAIYYGVKTGFNNAFIINNRTKEALIKNDPTSAEIIRPVLRGRDIQRYQAQWNGQWLIATFPALGLKIDKYPAVKEHLLSYGRRRLEQSGIRYPDGIRSRKRTSNAWFEIQDTCAYHSEFKREKLLWIDLTDQGRFAYDASDMFCVNSAYMMTGRSIKYLCALLNSTLVTWFMQKQALNSGMGTTRWVRFTVDRIPVPLVDARTERPLKQLVDDIIQATYNKLDSAALESDLNALVYDLYGVSNDEIRVIEGA